MKMADGGFRTAYNIQFATDLDALVVVGVETTNAGNDNGQLGAMQPQLKADYAVAPKVCYVVGHEAPIDVATSPAARLAALRRWLPQASFLWRMRAMAAARSACQPPAAGWSGLNPRAGASRWGRRAPRAGTA